MRVKLENHGFWKNLIFGERSEVVERGTFFELVFGYKNHRQPYTTIYISQEEYERLKPELAKYGWHI